MHKVKFSIFHNQSFIDLSLYQFGHEHCEPGQSFGPARRNHYLFHYIISGKGTLMADDSKGHTNTWQINRGQGFLIFPEQVNTYVADIKHPWEYTWLEFDGLRVKQLLETAGFSLDRPVYNSTSEKLSENVRDEMLYIVDHDDAGTLHLIAHLYLFMDYLTYSTGQSVVLTNKRLRDFYIREAIAFIENNYKDDITITDIAKTLKLNRSYFGKIFRQTLGKSPQHFLMNYRMVKAAELLTLTKLSISEIGISVGYQNQMHFSRAFRIIYSMSPREWRNKNQA